MRQVKLNPELCVTCETCQVSCALEHSVNKDINKVLMEKPRPVPRLKIKTKNSKPQLVRCKNCKKPKCMDVCETGAIYKKDGYVLIEKNRCNGCWKCVGACPFKAVWKSPDANIVVKCDSCVGHEPACVTSCRTGALVLVEGEGED